MIIEDFDAGVKPEKKGILVPILLGCMWCVLAASLLWTLAVRYHAQMAAVSLSENRFITAEWSLLQELKVQTDTKLLEKDQEIADLRRQYLSLSERKASPDVLRGMEIKIEEADRERQEIALAKSVPAVATTPKRTLDARLAPLVDPARLPEILSAQIRTLQAQLDERRLYANVLEEQLKNEGRESSSETQGARDQTENQETIQALQKELAAAQEDRTESLKKAQVLEAELAQARGDLQSLQAQVTHANEDQAEGLQKTKALQAELAQGHKAEEAARAALQAKKDEASPAGLAIKDLTTWTLLRAIVSSPGIREQYPDLLTSMDRYLEGYGRQERAKGNKEAYSAALSILDSAAPGAKGP
ncbi:MAG TPA: hypothetical protein VL354_12695 [Spirochaetia bacterium]|nr:hypothetical protein [Spirochaetia bacterium]